MQINKHFAKKYILASNEKRTTHKYLPKKEALECKFIQFNASAITSISVDIDRCDIFALAERLKRVPTPSVIVETDNGFHIHYFLTYPISYKKHTLVRWATHIRNELSKLVQGDKCAEGIKRLYRNPLTHSSITNNNTYTLSDFNISYPKNTYRNSKRKPTISYDFTSINVGERHTSMFNYLRTEAYKKSDNKDLEEILKFLANEANAMLSTPLPCKQIEQLIDNIMKFMGRYTGTKNQAEFNRTIAQNKHKNTILKAVKALEALSLKKVRLFSNRKISRVGGIAPSTVGLHREEILDILINKVLTNMRLSLEEYKVINGDFMTYTFRCTEPTCREEGKTILIDIDLKNYDEEVKKLRCTTCGSLLHRQFTSPSVKTFGDGYKSSNG